jgi:carotene biosynthesis associated membrane protein
MTVQFDETRRASWTERAFMVCLVIFTASIVFSLAGTLLLVIFPGTMATFGPHYATLVKAPTWTYMAFLPLLPVFMYWRSLGPALVFFFLIWGSMVGGMSELAGTQTGWPFGAYSYTQWLGPKLLDHVPYFIPLSWFAMSIVSLDLAARLTHSRVTRVVVASVFMVLWDVALDPAMSRAFPFWVYPEGGFFFGMPASNWAGWFLVSLVIMAGYEWIGGGLRRPSTWAPTVYVLNGLFPALLSFLYGLHVAGVIGLLAIAMPLLAVAGRTGGWRSLLPDRRRHVASFAG